MNLKLVVGAIFIASTQLAYSDTAKLDAACNLVSDYAAAVEQMHQLGAPLVDVLGTAPDGFRPIVLRAYDVLRWPTEDSRASAIADFRDEIALECFSGKLNLSQGGKSIAP